MHQILFATDGSVSARKALELAVDLAKIKNAKLLILHAFRSGGIDFVPVELAEYARVENLRVTERELYAEVAERIARDAERAARDLGAHDVETLSVEGDPVQSIVDTARDRGVDVIVVGSRGVGDLRGLLLGSVSHKVAHLAPCTCIVVK